MRRRPAGVIAVAILVIVAFGVYIGLNWAALG
jgi:hypothetical protein